MIPFNIPTELGDEFEFIRDAITQKKISGDGKYTRLCEAHLSGLMGGARALLTTSCTDALEMAAILADLGPGDEVLMPSFAFPSAANCVVLRRATPVFVDIRPDTLNIDENKIEAAITPLTKAIIVIHYAGVGCEMDTIREIAAARGLLVIEDAAQAIYASYRSRPLGTFGDFAAFSFHETKNIVAGEGGALIVNRADFVDRAEIIWEKGTNRVQFRKGLTSKYRWVDVGSSFLPSEITAAFLYAQLRKGPAATGKRLALWRRYHEELSPLHESGAIAIPKPPAHCDHNGHIFFIVAPTPEQRDAWLAELDGHGVNAVTHYVPLHSAPAGLKYGRTAGPLPVTDDISARLIRLPLHLQLAEADQARIVALIKKLAG